MAKPIEKSSLLGNVPQTVERHPTHEEIELRAYQIYVECGCPDGQDVEHWLQAERQLVQKYAKPSRTVGAGAR